MHDTTLRRLGATLLGFALAAAVPNAARADVPGEHPHYLHALHDLRYARFLLDRPDEWNVVRDQHAAVVEIDQAIGELAQAAADDGKDLDARERVDTNLSHRGRLERALTLVGAARRDVAAFEEDDWAARPLQRRATGDIDDAARFVRAAIRADRFDDVDRE